MSFVCEWKMMEVQVLGIAAAYSSLEFKTGSLVVDEMIIGFEEATCCKQGWCRRFDTIFYEI